MGLISVISKNVAYTPIEVVDLYMSKLLDMTMAFFFDLIYTSVIHDF